jgi:hypothetical protein
MQDISKILFYSILAFVLLFMISVIGGSIFSRAIFALLCDFAYPSCFGHLMHLFIKGS